MVEKEKMMKCCVHTWRITFIVLNSIFFIIGLALLGLAIYLLASSNDLRFLTGNDIGSGAVLILIAGFITAVISFIGILGAIGMWPVLLIIYIVLLFLIVILEIVAGILGFVFRTDLVEASELRASDAIRDFRPENDTDFRSDINSVVNFLQERFTCCGFTSNSQWLNTAYFNITMMYPESCICTPSESMEEDGNNCMQASTPVSSQMIYGQSCNATFNQFLRDNLIVVGVVGIVFGLFEVIGIGVAIALTCCFCVIRRNKDDYEFTKAV